MSTLFNLPVPVKEKAISHHPWEKTIKDVYSNRIKYGHNSIRNPRYPLKEKKPFKNRVKFTVIGNRVTKEFIYCVNLVKGMHKYREKIFDAPIIRGVTGVEWPEVWNNLKIQYGGLSYCLTSQVAVLINDQYLGGNEELKEFIESKYTYHLCLNYYKESVTQFANFVKSSGRPFAYMHFAINNEHIGTMILMLYADIVPYTCENFLRLCKEKKGGYGGTTVHRIVKDGWIQCGGYGLKSTDLDCENFIVPFDRRGVVAMANAGRHVDCSTQFYILLQPAPWMACKYVAFGQLVDGENTLKKIESVSTWYESPTSDILIYQAGILNMDCQDIMINRSAKEYIQGHIEDLISLGEILIQELMDKLFLEIEFRRIASLEQPPPEYEIGEETGETKGLHATRRFMRKKEDIEKQLEKGKTERSQSAASKITSKRQIQNRPDSAISNNEFDVEEYEYVPEEYSYQHVSLTTASIEVKPEKPYYIPLTDVLYPGEVDSTYDLKKLLKGDYCLESDLELERPKNPVAQKEISFPSELFTLIQDDISVNSDSSLDSDEQREIKKYIQYNVDRVSFAGGIIKGIARGVGKYNIFEDARKSELITDEVLRRFRKVSISVPEDTGLHRQIKRRQTGFARPQDLEKIHIIHKSYSEVLPEEEDTLTDRKVRIDPKAVTSTQALKVSRRLTSFVKPEPTDSDAEVHRQSVLTRLYEDIPATLDDEPPTLKDYRPISELHPKNILLTFSPNAHIRGEENAKEKYLRHSVIVENDSFEQMFNMQHGKKVARKISSDYVKTIDQVEHKGESSIRTVEFAKTRPSISVVEYQKRNQKYLEDLKNKSRPLPEPEPDEPQDAEVLIDINFGGLRLPGDTPLYVTSDDEDEIIT